jgi:hypothetical protein
MGATGPMASKGRWLKSCTAHGVRQTINDHSVAVFCLTFRKVLIRRAIRAVDRSYNGFSFLRLYSLMSAMSSMTLLSSNR